MSITSALVLYAVVWFMTFFIALPLRIQTQGDLNKIEPGTHAGAPEHHHLQTKAKITTVVALVIWAILVGIIVSGVINVRDFDWMNRMGPAK